MKCTQRQTASNVRACVADRTIDCLETIFQSPQWRSRTEEFEEPANGRREMLDGSRSRGKMASGTRECSMATKNLVDSFVLRDATVVPDGCTLYRPGGEHCSLPLTYIAAFSYGAIQQRACNCTLRSLHGANGPGSALINEQTTRLATCPRFHFSEPASMSKCLPVPHFAFSCPPLAVLLRAPIEMSTYLVTHLSATM